MPRYIDIPTETIAVINYATGRRTKRSTDMFEEGGGSCGNCGANVRVILEDDPPYDMARMFETFIMIDAKLQAKTEEKNGRQVQTPEGLKTMKCVAAIRKAFRGKKPGDEMVVDEPHWERIKELFEHPGNTWNMAIMAQFEPFFEAWNNAKEESRAERAKKAELERAAAAAAAATAAAAIPVPVPSQATEATA